MRDDHLLVAKLQTLGLSQNEALIFLALLDAPKNPTEVSRLTGIARSNVYRIVDTLVEKGILREQTTTDGKLLAAADPTALELLIVSHEHAVQQQRLEFTQLLPSLVGKAGTENSFSIHTYRGLSGIKQMLWNELKSKEILIFCAGSLDIGPGRRWAEKYRAEIIARNITQRSIENSDSVSTHSEHRKYTDHYDLRFLPKRVLAIQPEITIHDDTISIYNSWEHDVQLGTEIKNPFLAAFMRQLFEHYWQMAEGYTE
jgi:sugar-specific transcriptional regulator TrmB